MVALAHNERRYLRVADSHEFARRRQAELAALRRRAAAVGLAVVFLVALGVFLGRTGQTSAVTSRGDTASLPVATRAYVVQPGDTLWGIARALQPTGDVRPLVAQLSKARQGQPLREGERIALP